MNDFQIWQKAMKKINLTESAAPFVRGVLLVEDSEVEMYNKIQKLLNTHAMESSHPFLYNLDPLELSESEISKVNNLYKLGVDRGFIEEEGQEDDETADSDVKECGEIEAAIEEPNTFTVVTKAPVQVVKPVAPANQNAYVILYSAMRNGQIKTGEAFSNSLDTRSAKADVISKLEKAGYQNISILAIEAGDPDMAGVSDVANDYSTDSFDVPDYAAESEDDLEEADDREPLSHAFDPIGIKASTANSKAQDAVSMTMISDDEEELEEADDDEESKDDSAEDDKSDDKDDDKKDEESKDDSEESEDDETEEKEEKAEEPDEKLKDDGGEDDKEADDSDDTEKDGEKELSASEKESLRDSYKKAFKAAMLKCKFETSFSELSLEDKVKFFTELAKAWGKKADPSKFMSDKEIDQLEKIVVKK